MAAPVGQELTQAGPLFKPTHMSHFTAIFGCSGCGRRSSRSSRLTSLGTSGGLFATPIINHPEVAILGIHRIRPRPVVVDGQVVVREMGNISLSFDHRVIDGLVAADATYALIHHLERPETLFLDMA